MGIIPNTSFSETYVLNLLFVALYSYALHCFAWSLELECLVLEFESFLFFTHNMYEFTKIKEVWAILIWDYMVLYITLIILSLFLSYLILSPFHLTQML